MVRSLEVAGYRPILDQSFPLQGLADAFRRQESGAHFGKIVVEY
jgi:NADPH:quinone reductase-like Zn-dependent oxidoreductase